MANKRMFALTIIDSDAFLDMPQSTQLLYFHLGMRADDDGFINNVRTIMRICGAKEDDYKLLIVKKFIIPFDSGVVVIKHWRINNYIQSDRHHETKYLEEKSLLKIDEKGGYTLGDGKELPSYSNKKKPTCIQNGYRDLDLDLDLDLDKEIKLDITRYKQSALLELLNDCEYLTNNDLLDYSYDELLNSYVETFGYVDTKIKVNYFIETVCHPNEKGIYKYIDNNISNKYLYLKSSLDKAFEKLNG